MPPGIRMNDARVWLAALAGMPILIIGASLVRLEVERLRRLAVAAAAAMLLLLSVASVWTFWSGIADPAHQYQRRIVAAYLGVSTLLLAAGVALIIGPGEHGTMLEATGLWLIVIAALIRKGIMPFHAWVPE